MSDKEDKTPGPSNLERFSGDAATIVPLSIKRTVDKLTEEEKAANAEHDRILAEANEGGDTDEE